MSLGDDPIKGFVAAIGSADPDELAAYLDPSVEWIIKGLPTVKGRESTIRFWRQLLPRYRTIRVSLNRLVADGDTRIAEQTHLLDRGDADPLLVANIAVYRLRDGRILHWADHVDLGGVAEAEVALWRRLRAAA